MFTPSKLGETRLQKLQNGRSFFRENPLKISHGINFAPKIIPGDKYHVVATKEELEVGFKEVFEGVVECL